MRVTFSPDGWDDYCWWQSIDATGHARVMALINDALRNPTNGLGKPELLRHDLKGYWSRRIDLEHRLVYRVYGSGAGQTIEILQCRYHYKR